MIVRADYIWVNEKETLSKSRFLNIIDEFDPREDLPPFKIEIAGKTAFLNPNFYMEVKDSNPPRLVVLCDALNEDATPHASNKRAQLIELLQKVDGSVNCFIKTQFKVEAKERAALLTEQLKEAHIKACLDYDLALEYYDTTGVNPEYSVGLYTEGNREVPLIVAGQFVLSNWLLKKSATELGIALDLTDKALKIEVELSGDFIAGFLESGKKKLGGGVKTDLTAKTLYLNKQAAADPYEMIATMVGELVK